MTWEEQRQLLTDIDFLIRNSSELLLENTLKNGIFKDYIISKNLNLIQYKSKKVLQFAGSERDVELNKITNTSGELKEFYQELNKLKTEFSLDILTPSKEEKGERDWQGEKEEFEKMFTGEEGLGHYLDLLEFYQTFLQFSKTRRIKYLDYVKNFYDFTKINDNTKQTREYRKYVKDLGVYMETFIAKTRPLQDLDERKQEIIKKFHASYSLEKVVKEFYCNVCQKDFQKETVFSSHLKGKKHLKNLQNSKEKQDEIKELKMWEYLVQEYTQELQNVIEESVFHVERKQTLTEKEYMEEAMEEPVVLSDVESDDSEALYNPLKLPMGWDGKPIPYWLYKLHGLGVEYKCEICGNFVYMGRKAFEGHFSAFRHIYGLRCLGITNTRHFSEITSIQDALGLWERLQNDEREEEAARDAVEEYEDDYGNVFNKKTYEDLKRQGLL